MISISLKIELKKQELLRLILLMNFKKNLKTANDKKILKIIFGQIIDKMFHFAF